MKHLLLVLIVCFYGIANAQFGPQIPVTDGGYYNIFELGDIDGDGDKDLIYNNRNSCLTWRENEGGSVFRNINTIYMVEPDEGSAFLHPVDYDMDGDLDIIATLWYKNEVFWFENIGGKFGPKQIILEIPIPRKLYSGDFDNDGDLDLLINCIIEDNYSLAYVENIGIGEFEDPVVVTMDAHYLFACEVADIDDDGDLDVATAKYVGDEIVWNENVGDGVFSPDKVLSGAVDGPTEIRIEDINGDDKLDIITFSPNDDEIVWYENLGAGTFGPKQEVFESIGEPKSLKFSDFDGDGDKDLVIIYSPIYLSTRISWFPNLGDGSFGAENILDSTTFYHAINIDDIDNDGDLDILYGSYLENELSLSRNAGGGVFEDRVPLTNELFGLFDIAAADMDNDGDLDIVSVAVNETSGLVWVENHGTGILKDIHIVEPDLPPLKIAKTADMDGDGDNDIIAMPYSDGNIRYFENLGTGIFAAGILLDAPVSGWADLELVDLNGDGNLDILTAASSDEIAWHENTGDSFAPSVIISTEVIDLRDIHAVDLDEDGDIDLLSASFYDDKIAWYENTGDGTFGPQIIISEEATEAEKVLTTDIDSDGDLDILMITKPDIPLESKKLSWFENDGVLGFSTTYNLYETVGLTSILPEDFDSDGHIDLVVGVKRTLVDDAELIATDELTWHKNLGDGSFAPPVTIEHMFLDFRTALSGDIDNDGDLDLITASQSDCALAWHENLILSPRQARGKVYFDLNENGAMDPDEEGLNMVQIESDPESAFSYSLLDGAYLMNFDEGAEVWYEIKPENMDNWNITSDSLSYHVLADAEFVYVDSLYFGLYPNTLEDDIQATLSAGFPRCNSIVNFWLTAGNIGTTIPSGVMQLSLDEDLVFEGASVEPDSIVDGSIYWSYDSLFYFNNKNIIASISLPGAAFMGDTVSSSLIVHALDITGEIVDTDTNTVDQVIVCAYDPNDKQVIPAGEGDMGNISPLTTDLQYIVRFQNTGTDTAIHVVIKDQLDPNLDWSSLQPLSNSHEMEVYINPSGEVSFTFNNIMLPDSNVNEMASHGFVTYRIDLKPDLPLGTSIYNTAHIYFDANPAIVTNTTINTLDSPAAIFEYNENSELKTVVYPNPFSDYTTLYFSQHLTGKYTLEIVDLIGKKVYLDPNITGEKVEIQRGTLKQGMYVLSILNSDTGIVESSTKLIVK
jgi:hypothetical protein